MSLPEVRKRNLNLDKDLALDEEDLRALKASQTHDPRDLGSYLDFLDEVWGLGRKERGKRFFSAEFRLGRRKKEKG